MNSVSVLVEAKKEYTNQLQQILTPRLYEGFKSIYEDIINILSEEVMEKQMQNASIIKTFQKSLKDIPVWNNEMIKNEYGRIEKASNCDYLENLIEAVFISNTKILTSVQINNNTSMNIRINVPQPQHFIHKCYIECSKEIYKNPYIFDNSKTLTPKEKHTNLRETISLINHAITNAVRDLLPIRDILKQGLINKSYENNDTPNEINDKSIEDENESSIINDESSNKDDEDSDNEEENTIENKGDENLEEIEIKSNNEENNEINEEFNDEDSVKDENNSVKEIIDENKEINLDYENLDKENSETEKVIKIEDNQNLDNIIIKDNEESNVEENNNLRNFFDNDNIDNKLENQELNDNNLGNNENSKDNEEHIKNIELNIRSNNERKFLENNTKNIEIQKNSILKKIDNVEKVDKKEINELIVPKNNINNENTITNNNFIKEINNNRFIKRRVINRPSNNSFYQKKYSENLANINNSYEGSDDERNKKVINLNVNSSDDEDSDIDFE